MKGMRLDSIAKRIKIFADGADVAALKALSDMPFVQGLTTNPTLMKRAGITDYVGFAHDLLKQVPHKPISFEVFSDDFGEMYRQAMRINEWGDNVYVKIPVSDTAGRESFDLIRRLSREGVQLNVTAVLTMRQVVLASEALKNGAPSFLSIFAGRIADTGRDPQPIMKAAVEICRAAEASIEVLWASTREVYNIVQAVECGCSIITVTPDILAKLSKTLDHDLHELSIDTVSMFHRDAQAAGFVL